MRTVKTLVTVWQPSTRKRDDVLADDELQAAVPAGVELHFLEPGQKLSEHLAGVEVLYGPVPEKDLAKADSLRWIQLNSTGADAMLYDAFIKSGIKLTTLGGAITDTVAEHALVLLFALARNVHLQRDLQREKTWRPLTGTEIGGMKLGILGFGRIGRAIAARAHGFGMEILAVDANPVNKPDFVRALWGLDRVPDLFRQSNALICVVPKTPATSRMISAEQLALMPRGSFIVNVGRGGVIDEGALVAAVRSGHLGGVGLDVTEVEPLPADSPLWNEPNILLTAHSAGFTKNLREKKTRWFADNLARYIRGEPLQGLVDPARGY
ncbi:MAG: D-2-hydroxyacid dehydrogenase [Verrucomicrobia bacterium]|nr:D-2-hydroxyacid dehydrogenase [Verrucomicrobiota bacterium]